MSKPRFTKKPWRWADGALMSSDGSAVAMADYSHDINDYSVEVSNQDANLIAAAPDLYEALDKAVNLMIETRAPSNHSVVILARQALAKARGEK